MTVAAVQADTTRESRLRGRIDRERDGRRKAERERDRLVRTLEGRASNADLRALVAARPAAGYDGRCCYCGSRTVGRVCPAHRDLVALDPFYAGR